MHNDGMVERWFSLLLVLVAGLSIQQAGTSHAGELHVFVTQLDGEPVLELLPDEPVYTASLSKLLVVEQLLEREDPAPEVLELMRRAIELSDDDAMDQLWVQHDGPGLISSAITSFGLTGTALPAQAGRWGEATTTARDYANLLINYRTRLTVEDSFRLSGWLRNAADAGADGFDQNFGLNAVPGAASKQGWSCCPGDERLLHSAGVTSAGTVVVVLGTFATSTDWSSARESLNTAVQAAIGAVE